MNIVVDISALKQENPSGVGRYLYEILSRLLILDQENEYFLFSFGRKNKDIDTKLPHNKNIHYVHKNISSKLLFFLHYFLKLFGIHFFNLDNLRINGKNIKMDLVWLPNFNIYNLKYKNTRLISTIHDLSFKIYPQFFNFQRKIWHFLVNPKKIIQQSDKLLAVSENTSQDLINLYQVKRKNILVTRLGVNKKYRVYPEQDLEKIRKKYSLFNDFILFVGTKEVRKNIISILKAFTKLKIENLELLIVGPQGWKQESWQSFYNNLDSRIKSRIRILNYFSEADLPGLYNLAKIFIWPSFYEGFGLPVLEAMACQCPIITSNNSSLPAIVQDNALIVESFNIQTLYLALDNLIHDKNLYNFYKRKKFDTNYYLNWEKSAEKLLKLFKKI